MALIPCPQKKEKKPERCRTIDQLKLTMIGGGGGGGGGMDAGFLGVLVHSGCCIRFFSASLLENLTPVFFPSERNNHIYQKNSKFLRTPPVTTIVPSLPFCQTYHSNISNLLLQHYHYANGTKVYVHYTICSRITGCNTKPHFKEQCTFCTILVLSNYSLLVGLGWETLYCIYRALMGIDEEKNKWCMQTDGT